MNAVNELWQQSQASSGHPENVVEGLPSRVREDRVIVVNDKEEASTKEEETKEVEEDDEVRDRDCTLFPGSRAEGVE